MTTRCSHLPNEYGHLLLTYEELLIDFCLRLELFWAAVRQRWPKSRFQQMQNRRNQDRLYSSVTLVLLSEEFQKKMGHRRAMQRLRRICRAIRRILVSTAAQRRDYCWRTRLRNIITKTWILKRTRCQ